MGLHAMKKSKAWKGNRHVEGWCFGLKRGEMCQRPWFRKGLVSRVEMGAPARHLPPWIPFSPAIEWCSQTGIIVTSQLWSVVALWYARQGKLRRRLDFNLAKWFTKSCSFVPRKQSHTSPRGSFCSRGALPLVASLVLPLRWWQMGGKWGELFNTLRILQTCTVASLTFTIQ